MTKIGVVAPDGLPLRSVVVYVSVVGYDVDVFGLVLSEKDIEDPPQYRIEAGGDDVEGDPIVEAEIMERPEVRIDLERFFHDLEAILERDPQGPPHLLRNITEGPLAGADLLVEYLTFRGAAAEVVEEHMTSVLHKDCTIKV